jgi:hypothetical protein
MICWPFLSRTIARCTNILLNFDVRGMENLELLTAKDAKKSREDRKEDRKAKDAKQRSQRKTAKLRASADSLPELLSVKGSIEERL